MRHQEAMKFLTCFCLCLSPLFSMAADLPPPVLPDGVGVNIHFTQGHGRDLDLIAAAGFRFIRMDFGWESTEPEKGKYDWSAYDALTADLEQRGLRAIYILDYSNPLYEEAVAAKNPINGQMEQKSTASPQHPESVAAFARWAGAAAEHFRGHRIIWEIWNEPNISFWKPQPDAQQYAALALATCRALRAADTNCTIIAPASSSFPWEFLEVLFKSGALEYLDAVSVHPYRRGDQEPETAKADYDKLRALIDRYAPDARRGRIPVISGEWGYSTCVNGVSLETQAAYLVRQQLANLLNGVPLSIWYDWKNDGPDPKENEHNFGTVLPDLTPKPAYRALSVMTRELAGCRIVRRLKTASDADYLVLLANAKGQTKIAAWTTGKPHDFTLNFDAKDGTVSLVAGDGSVSQLDFNDTSLTIQLKPLPSYLTLGELSVGE
jgi:hypothetical protein